jgi:hypothetical protein
VTPRSFESTKARRVVTVSFAPTVNSVKNAYSAFACGPPVATTIWLLSVWFTPPGS